MTSYDDLLKVWRNLFDTKQNAMPFRTGLLGDGKDNVVIGTSMPGWSWIRYDSNPHRVSMVINQYEHWADDTPVVVGKRHPDDADEQVLGINFAHHEYALSAQNMAYMFAPPHGESHLSSHTDPACIDTGNIMDGKVVATVPASMEVYVHAFVYPDNCNASMYAGGSLDLSGYVPGVLYVDVHWYVLVYFSLDDNELHAVHGDSVELDVVPAIPDTPSNGIPLAIIDVNSSTTAIITSMIYQYKIIWDAVCGPIGIHTHTDDSSGGSSILGLEELMFECAEPLEIQIHTIHPTQVYHALTVSGMYAGGPYDLETIVPDPLYGCGQLLIIRLAPTMYGAYSVVVKHGVGNIWLSNEADITLDKPTDHLTLIYNGAYWCDILPTGADAAGGAPVGAQYVVMGLDAVLTGERVLTAGAHLNLADGGAGGNATLSIITVPNHLHAGVAGDGNEIPVTSLSGHVRGSIIRGEAADWAVYNAKTQYQVLEGDGTDIISVMTSDGQMANRVVRTNVNRAIRPRRLGLHAAPPDQDGAMAFAETADPTNVAGVGMLYAKDAAGITRLYFMRDDGTVIDIRDHGNLDGLTDDDHTQYLLASGARALTGDLETLDLVPDINARQLGDATHRYDLYTTNVIFGGATGANIVHLTDNLADGLHFADLGTLADHYLTFVTTNAQREVTFNENGADIDFRVEGDTVGKLIFADASVDKVGIGGDPLTNLHVFGKTNVEIRAETAAGSSQAAFRLKQHDAGHNNDYFGFTLRGDGAPDVRTSVYDDSGAAFHNMYRFYYLTDRIRLYGQTGFDCIPNSLTEWNMATENLEFVDAGSVDATEHRWIQIEVGGVTSYIRTFAAK